MPLNFMALFESASTFGESSRDAGAAVPPPPGGQADLSGTDDAVLLDHIAKGDQNAMAMVFSRYSKVVYSVALRVLRDAGTAEDVLQDIFMQIWRKPEAFLATRGSLGSWLAVVARNRAIDVLRRRKPLNDLEDVVLASSFNLAQASEHTLLVQRVQGLMQSLPAPQRHVLELAYFEGLTHTEIAERTGDPLGTVKTRIRSALLVLRRGMQA